MNSMQWPLMEVSRCIKDDPQANRLLDEFLDACFASMTPPAWAPLQVAPTGGAEHLVGTLAALNGWLRERYPGVAGLAPPADMPLEAWAEEIADQVLTNCPC